MTSATLQTVFDVWEPTRWNAQTALSRYIVDMMSHPAPSVRACTGITGVITSLTQIRMRVDPHSSVRDGQLTVTRVCFSPHNAASDPTAGALILLHLWVSPYQGMQPRQAGNAAYATHLSLIPTSVRTNNR